MIRSNMFVIYIFLLFHPLILTAQTNSLSIDDCIERALVHNYDLRIQQERIAASEADLTMISKSRLPQLKAGGNYIRFSEVMEIDISENMDGLPFTLPPAQLRFGDEDNYAVNLSLFQPLFTGFKLSNSIKAAEANLFSQREINIAEINQLAFDIKARFYTFIGAEQQKRIAEISLQSVISHLADVNNFYNQGMLTYNEILKTEIRKSEMELLISKAENQMIVVNKSLMHLLGMTLEENIQLEADLIYEPFDIQIDNAIREALEQRPELKNTGFHKSAMSSMIKASQADYYPNISLICNYEYGKPGLNKLENKWMDYWTVGISAQWNVWDWGIRKAKVQHARASYNRTDQLEDKIRETIRLDVYQSHTRKSELDLQVKLYHKIREQAEENYRILSDKFNQGLATNTDFLDGETQLTKAKLDEIKALAGYYIAVADLERSMGRNNRRSL